SLLLCWCRARSSSNARSLRRRAHRRTFVARTPRHAPRRVHQMRRAMRAMRGRVRPPARAGQTQGLAAPCARGQVGRAVTRTPLPRLKMLPWLFAAFVALFAPSFAGCSRYDELVDKDQLAEARWADVEAQLQRRADLIPNLVAVVRGSAKHEEQTLKAVTEA